MFFINYAWWWEDPDTYIWLTDPEGPKIFWSGTMSKFFLSLFSLPYFFSPSQCIWSSLNFFSLSTSFHLPVHERALTVRQGYSFHIFFLFLGPQLQSCGSFPASPKIRESRADFNRRRHDWHNWARQSDQRQQRQFRRGFSWCHLDFRSAMEELGDFVVVSSVIYERKMAAKGGGGVWSGKDPLPSPPGSRLFLFSSTVLCLLFRSPSSFTGSSIWCCYLLAIPCTPAIFLLCKCFICFL